MKKGKHPPLLPWLLFYCFGLILAGNEDFVYVYFIIFTVLLLVFVWWFRPPDRFIVTLFSYSAGLLGFLSMSDNLPRTLNTGDKAVYLGRIKEQVRASEWWSTNLVELDAVERNGEWNALHHTVLLMAEREGNLFLEGDRILFHGRLEEIRNPGNPGEFDQQQYWHSKGVRYQGFVYSEGLRIVDSEGVGTVQELFITIRQYASELIDRFVGDQYGAIVKALLLGDKSELSGETRSAFAKSGAMHMLAVSGLHVGIIAYLLNALFERLFFGVRRRYANVLLILVLWFYAFVTGFSPSVTRAVIMFTVLIGAQLFFRTHDSLNSLCVAALILLVYNPLLLYDIGFQLSFLAMLGIFTVYPLISQWFYFRIRLLRTIWQGTAVGLSAQVFTAPLSLYYFHQFPNYFVLTNIGVMALAGSILGTAILLIAIGKIPILNTLTGYFLMGLTGALLLFVEGIERLPGAVATGFDPGWWWLLLTYGVLLAALVVGHRYRWVYLLPCAMIIPLQWGRLHNLEKQEVVVFNANHLTILINNGQEQLCFYGGDEAGLKNARRLMNDYGKLHPGKQQFAPLKIGQCVLESNEGIKINRKTHCCTLQLGGARLVVLTSARAEVQQSDTVTMYLLPNNIWFPVHPSHDLSSVAYRIPFP